MTEYDLYKKLYDEALKNKERPAVDYRLFRDGYLIYRFSKFDLYVNLYL